MITLITGAAGKIGSELAERIPDAVLIDKKPLADPRALNVDLRSLVEVKKCFEHADVGVVYHCAAFTSNLSSIREPWKSWDTNVIGTQNLLSCLRKDVKFILPSCLHVKNPMTPYHLSKINQEALVAEMVDHHICRAGEIFGVEGMVSEMIRRAMENLSITIHGPHRIVDLMHVDDYVNRLQDLDNPRSITLNLMMLAEMIVETCNSSSKIICKPQNMHEPSHRIRAYHTGDLNHFQQRLNQAICHIIELNAADV